MFLAAVDRGFAELHGRLLPGVGLVKPHEFRAAALDGVQRPYLMGNRAGAVRAAAASLSGGRCDATDLHDGEQLVTWIEHLAGLDTADSHFPVADGTSCC